PDTATLMNELFVCIKLDREERPDLDSIYMEACQAMTGGGGWPVSGGRRAGPHLDSIYMEACQAMTGAGGWPLNVFLTPEQVPFYAGTYFPPAQRMGMPAWRQVLEAVAHG